MAFCADVPLSTKSINQSSRELLLAAPTQLRQLCSSQDVNPLVEPRCRAKLGKVRFRCNVLMSANVKPLYPVTLSLLSERLAK